MLGILALVAIYALLRPPHSPWFFYMHHCEFLLSLSLLFLLNILILTLSSVNTLGQSRKFRKHWVKKGCSIRVSDPLNGSGSCTQAKVGVLLILSSLSANRLKAWASVGWSSDITTEVLGDSSIVVTGSPSVSAGVLPARAEFRVWQRGMMIQGG